MNILSKPILSACTFILCFVLLQAGSARATIHIDHPSLNQAIADQSASDYLETLYQNKLDSGIENFIPLSLLLISTSKKMLADNEPATALTCARYARRFSPDFPPAIMHEHYVNWRSNRLRIDYLLIGCIQGYLKKLTTLDELAFYAFSQLAAIGTALMLTLAGIGLLSLVRNCRLLAHDVRHVLSEALPAQATVAVLVLICVLPLLLGLSVTWLFPYWLMLFWSYHSHRERTVIGILVALFACAVPLLAVACSYLLYMPQSDSMQRLWQANYGYYTKFDIEVLEQYAVQSSDDYELLFSAGLVNKREQNYATALSYYKRILKHNPRDYKACINAGNVYFAIGDWEKAVEKYRTAIAAAPDRCGAAHFNLARAYQQKFMFKDAEQSLAHAKRLDSRRVETYLGIYSENHNRLLIDETIARKDIWIKGVREFLSQRQLISTLWDMFYTGLRLPIGILAVVVFLILNILYGVNDPVRIAMKCTLCGRTMCRRCQRNIAAEILCFQCQNFLKKQEQLSFKQKDAKRIQIIAYLRALRRWISLFSLLLPGIAHCFKGRFIQGTVYSFIFFLLLSKAMIAFLFKGPWYDLVNDRAVYIFFYALTAGILWCALFVHVRSVRSRELEDNVVVMSLGLDV